jgi:hypothetical protein
MEYHLFEDIAGGLLCKYLHSRGLAIYSTWHEANAKTNYRANGKDTIN